jgi:DNA-binding transcriptional LysR family regulator
MVRTLGERAASTREVSRTLSCMPRRYRASLCFRTAQCAFPDPRHGVAPHRATRAGAGTRLFLREPSGYVRTSAGERLMARAEALEQEVLACQATVASETDVAGRVLVTATEILASAFVLRHLPALRSAYPALCVELVRTQQTLNLSLREADIALRLARPHQLGLRARRIARLDFGLYASPAWIEQFGSPRDSSDLKNCDVIDWADERLDYPAIRWFTKAIDTSRVIFRANSASDRLTARGRGWASRLVPAW